VVAPLWVAYEVNLGTLLRTCDAIGACLAVPRTKHYLDALQVGDTLRGRRPCLHWVTPSKEAWIAGQRDAGKRIVAVELAEVDECVEIPMVGWGASLNVAVAGSLVAYRLAGLS
jgi:tRNA G18 (ribose-2'-O)-methylase SpoU